MVTANKQLPGSELSDVDGARAVDMQGVFIRGDHGIKDIIDLAERLGC